MEERMTKEQAEAAAYRAIQQWEIWKMEIDRLNKYIAEYKEPVPVPEVMPETAVTTPEA